jgi:hypothetical protein
MAIIQNPSFSLYWNITHPVIQCFLGQFTAPYYLKPEKPSCQKAYYCNKYEKKRRNALSDL